MSFSCVDPRFRDRSGESIPAGAEPAQTRSFDQRGPIFSTRKIEKPYRRQKPGAVFMADAVNLYQKVSEAGLPTADDRAIINSKLW